MPLFIYIQSVALKSIKIFTQALCHPTEYTQTQCIAYNSYIDSLELVKSENRNENVVNKSQLKKKNISHENTCSEEILQYFKHT